MRLIKKQVLVEAPQGLQATRLRLGDEELVIFSYPIVAIHRDQDPLVALLTPGERAVVRLLLKGWTQAEIAAERKVAQSTVATQVQCAYRKLGVGSRNELAVRVHGQAASLSRREHSEQRR